jgi:hypothetical protein
MRLEEAKSSVDNWPSAQILIELIYEENMDFGYSLDNEEEFCL